jgi:VWFA-related protein
MRGIGSSARSGARVFLMVCRARKAGQFLILAVFLVAGTGWSQTQQSQPGTSQKSDIPDAPSAVRPAQPFPTEVPPEALPPARETPPPSQPAPAETPPEARPPLNIKTVPEGGATQERDSANDELFRITKDVNQVLVPVRVTDDSGRLVDGLLAKDFAVYESGRKQALNFFTSDPFALSAAVVFDVGMPDAAVQKVNQTFPALEGAFSQYDEVALYTYSNTVGQMADFGAVGRKLTAVLNELKSVPGRNNGPPIMGGPLGPQGPVINGIPVDPSVPRVRTPPQESHVLNDAILAAALDLSKRDKARRRIIFIISDGRERGSDASYRDVLKVLLTNGIAVYGLGVGGAALPGYGSLQRLHLPRMGYGNLLPKYASATAGEYFPELSRNAIEDAYARAIGDARNQYTLGYVTRAMPSGTYRPIEVTVDRPDLNVYARDGYYPAPPGR